MMRRTGYWRHAAAVCVLGLGPVCAASTDPSGDAIANPPPLAQQSSVDLVRALAVTFPFFPGDLYVVLRFDGRIRAPSEAAAAPSNLAWTARAATGFVEFDLDNNSATGQAARQNAMSPPFNFSPLGIDGWFDLTTEATTPGLGLFVLPSGWPGGGGGPVVLEAELDYRYRSIVARVDLSDTPGVMFDLFNPPQFTAVVGNPLNMTDALNFAGVVQYIPGPGGVSLGAAVALTCLRRRRVQPAFSV